MPITSRCSRAGRIVRVATCSALLFGLGAVPARADTVTYTSGETMFVVPPGVSGLYVTAVGAQGGTGAAGGSGALGGFGGVAQALLAVAPGQTLYAEVGNPGTPASNQNGGAGGSGGGAGGAGGAFGFTAGGGGGGGGGAADLRTSPLAANDLTSRLITAPGGGGGGGGTIMGAGVGLGGGGGVGAGGGGGGTDPCGSGGAAGGVPGTASSGGTGGAPAGVTAGSGGTGGFGFGGFGGPSAGSSDGSGGGGAGAGWHGGGGGGGTDNYCKGAGGGAGGSVQFGAGTSNAAFGTATSATASVALNYLPPSVVTSDVVISQVYGDGETSGQEAPYQRDFIELFNRGGTPVDLGGWAVQYAGAAGSTWFKTPLGAVVVPAGGYVLVAESAAPGPDGLPLPTPDVTGNFAIQQSTGKVALTSTTTTLTGACPTRDANLRDFVGYGQTAVCWEGASQAAQLNAVTSDQRAGSGCTDTDSNSADFPSAGSPMPRNSASPAVDCSVPNAAVVASCGSGLTTTAGTLASKSISATDPDGKVTSFSRAVSPPSNGITLDSVNPAAGAGGTATATLNAAASTAAGSYHVTVTASNDDPAPQSGSCSLDVVVQAPPGADPGPGQPGPGAAPQVTALTLAEQLLGGRPGVLSAQVSGSASHLDWDVNGDGRTDVSCPGDQTTLRFRAPATRAARAAAFTGDVSVQAVDASGAAAGFSQSFTVAVAPTAARLPAAVKRIVNFAQAKPPVFVCGREADLAAAKNELTGNQPLYGHLELAKQASRWPCLDRTLNAGSLRITGCFVPIRSSTQIPPAEMGSLNPLLDISKQPRVGGSSDPHQFVEQGLDFTDAYISDQAVLVNGVKVDPLRAGRIVVFPQVDRIFSSDAVMSVGGIKLEHSRSFSLGLHASAAGAITFGSFPRVAGGISELGGFALTGDVRVVLKPGTATAPPGAEIAAELKLPEFLNLVPGVSTQGNVKVLLTSDGKLVLDSLKIGPIDAAVGPVGLDGLELTYARDTAKWHGMGRLCLAIACLDARYVPGEAPPGGVVISDGKLERLFVNLTFPSPGITLYPGIQLNRVGAGIGLNPTRFLGGARITALNIFEIDGALVLALPSAATPFKLTRAEAGNAFPDEFYTRDYTRATLAIGADAYLKLPIIDERIRLGGAYLLYHAPGYVAFGGGLDYDFFEVISVTGRTDGEFNVENGRFNLGGHAEVCLVDIFCKGSNIIFSSVGVGGCVNIDLAITDVDIGGGVLFDPFEVKVWPLGGCRWRAFHDPDVFEGGSRAKAAQNGAPFTVKIKAGDLSRAVQIDGADGAPRVRVTALGGEVLDSPNGPGVAATKVIRIMRSDKLKRTVVGLQDPKPGTYTIQALPGSPAIKKLTEAEDLPKAKISATVEGRGARRTLSYDIGRRPDQRVTFVETGADGHRPIGTVTGGRGKLAFTPAPGRGPRKIEAQFELDGLRAETLTVASFMPPSPRLGRPAGLRVSRRGTGLRVSWRRVADATHYDIVTTLDSGAQRKTRTRRNTITIAAVTARSGGRVAVRPTAPQREGAGRSARFRATARRAPTRVRPLERFGQKR